ncbi:MAG: ferrous iron transporter B, partial [Planctomycetes bacterium]|nr:ferrous iron transporter B [Planctomycetota bacterium]
WDRGSIFLRKAGTVILSICVVLWVLSHFPGSEAPPEALDLRARAEASSDPAEAETLVDRAEQLESRSTLRHSVAGRLGVAVEPILAPLGYDWQLSIGVLSSFAAREVFVSTLLVMLGIDEKGEIEDPSLIDVVRHAKRDDGTALLDRATSWSLLVFYVLAMQCLPTLAVTRREAGGWRWAALQLAVMTGLAYGAAALTHALLRIG